MLGIEDCFQSIVDTERFQRPQPDPEIFQVAMRDLALLPQQGWVIEDSIAGIGRRQGSRDVHSRHHNHI